MTSEERNEKGKALIRLKKAVELKNAAYEALIIHRGAPCEAKLRHRWVVLSNRVRRITWMLSGYD